MLEYEDGKPEYIGVNADLSGEELDFAVGEVVC